MLKLLIDRLEAISFEMTQAGNEYDGAAVAHAALAIKVMHSAPAKKTARAMICEIEARLGDLGSYGYHF
jgi:hypothetical protein